MLTLFRCAAGEFSSRAGIEPSVSRTKHKVE